MPRSDRLREMTVADYSTEQNLRLAQELLARQGEINQLTATLKRITDLAARWRARGDERCADELEAALQPNGEHNHV